MAQLLGGITGVFLFPWLINSAVRKLRRSDTPKAENNYYNVGCYTKHNY
jgi:hypothetical protein